MTALASGETGRAMLPPAGHGGRVGWCPGALRPMMVGDGLVMRVKPRGHRLSIVQARGIAAVAARRGNGVLTLTARGNIQLRGFDEAGWPAATAALAALDLLDATPEGEAVRNVVSSPLAGADPCATRQGGPAVAALEERLATDEALWRLPAKFGWSVDEGGSLPLGEVGTDVRFAAHVGFGTPRWTVALDGASERAEVPTDDLVAPAVRLAAAFLALCTAHALQPHRMRDLVAVCGASAVFARAGLSVAQHEADGRRPDTGIGLRRAGARSFVGAGPAFGLLDAATLDRVANFARVAGADAVRLTPWRSLLVAGLAEDAATVLAEQLAATALILDAADPRLRIAACVGQRGCRRGTTDVPADAARLAVLDLPGPLHVSGCAKGCARREPARATLVGRQGRYDLVLEGRADDPPVDHGLSPAMLATMLPARLEAAP